MTGDTAEFNAAVAAYRGDLLRNPPPGVDMKKIEFEAFFNSFQPFLVAMALYVGVFLLTACGWLGGFRGLIEPRSFSHSAPSSCIPSRWLREFIFPADHRSPICTRRLFLSGGVVSSWA